MQKYALITDGHALGQEIKQLIDYLISQQIRHFIFLGDQLGYGPDPDIFYQTIFWLIEEGYRVDCIKGNHEAALLESLSLDYDEKTDIGFNNTATASIFWTRDYLSQKDPSSEIIQYIQTLPDILDIEGTSLLIVHGSMQKPHYDHYLLNRRQWKQHIKRFKAGYPNKHIIAHGHTHQASCVKGIEKSNGSWSVYNRRAESPKTAWIIKNPAVIEHQKSSSSCLSINPGYGLPRRVEPGAMRYAIIEESEDYLTIAWYTFAFDIEACVLRVHENIGNFPVIATKLLPSLFCYGGTGQGQKRTSRKLANEIADILRCE